VGLADDALCVVDQDDLDFGRADVDSEIQGAACCVNCDVQHACWRTMAAGISRCPHNATQPCDGFWNAALKAVAKMYSGVAWNSSRSSDAGPVDLAAGLNAGEVAVAL
jgi:hypothetical protein